MNKDRQPYIVTDEGYALGPYRNEYQAQSFAWDEGDEVMWLALDDIDEYGYAVYDR